MSYSYLYLCQMAESIELGKIFSNNFSIFRVRFAPFQGIYPIQLSGIVPGPSPGVVRRQCWIEALKGFARIFSDRKCWKLEYKYIPCFLQSCVHIYMFLIPICLADELVGNVEQKSSKPPSLRRFNMAANLSKHITNKAVDINFSPKNLLC